MKKVGLTGGIGSGKSTICKIFEILGISIYQADERAKYLMQHNPELVSGITSEFGYKSYLHGQLNRSYLAKVVFSDANEIAKINALVHPVVSEDFKAWIMRQNSAYVIKEAAL